LAGNPKRNKEGALILAIAFFIPLITIDRIGHEDNLLPDCIETVTELQGEVKARASCQINPGEAVRRHTFRGRTWP
jgi:hypothetical protein